MTDSVNIRELAAGVLLEITRDGVYSHIALSGVLEKYQYLTKQERAFLTRVTEGTLEHMIELDYIINQYSSVKVNKLKPYIRCLLRNGVYELKYMDSVPASATCNEMVKLAKKKGFGRLSGFVNGVLRNVSRNLGTICYPDEEKEPLKSLSVRYSMPEWIVEQWMDAYGADRTKQLLEVCQQEAGLSIRTNLTKVTPEELKQRLREEGVTVREDKELPYAFYIEGVDYLNSLQSFRDGLFYVQDISSMRVAEAAEPKAGDHVIDVCAAPGGKSIHIAELLNGTGLVEARDLTEYKVSLIEQNKERCGNTNLKAVQHDARVLDGAAVKAADIVIADLPCSGLGVIRRKKDIRYRMTPEQQKELAELQREILSVVQQYPKDGGILIYSTCTISRPENEENVAWFLSAYPQYTLESMEQLLPTEGACDGFFIARLRKNKND